MPPLPQSTQNSLVLLELNEVNFTYLRRYIAQGHLPALAALIERHGITETSSESDYEQLEPWIQWVTAHTGLALSQHGVFRLGDIVHTEFDQTWEVLEQRGVSVGAVSPMNAKNRCRAARFFVPDPWTPTTVTGGRMITNLHRALAQTVSENAQGRVTMRSAFWLLAGFLRFGRLRSLLAQISYALRAPSQPWTKALFLDRLLADVFMDMRRVERPQFCTLFLNAAAHIQHHYMYCSAVYEGPHRNPSWYVKPGVDPLLEAYRLYDKIVADVLSMQPACRLIIATGLHQDPCPAPVYYYRLKDHAALLTKLGVGYESVLPLMSRDFLIHCTDRAACEQAVTRLQAVHSGDGTRVFSAEARDNTVFAMLTYPSEIKGPFMVEDGSGLAWDFSGDVVFVALKNGIHNGTGYVIDTANGRLDAQQRVPLASLHHRVLEAFAAVAPERNSARAV